MSIRVSSFRVIGVVCTANPRDNGQLPVLKARVYAHYLHSFTSNYRFISKSSSSGSSLAPINTYFTNLFSSLYALVGESNRSVLLDLWDVDK